MARQGASRPKVVSSGRLTAGGRAHINKKKVAGKSLPALEPAYSLYSTDSEDQVTTVHKGLDRCAALLNGILEAEQEESNSNARGVKSSISKSKPRNLSKKTEMGRKQQVRKTNAGMQAHRKPVQKILSAGSYPGLNPVNRDKPSGPALVRKTKHIRQHSVPALTQPAVNSEVQTQTTFNHRLTTSTPALSPQRSASAHSEPCSSKCSQNQMISPEECHLVTATQFPGSFSVPATVEQQCPIALQSHFQNTICPHVKQGLPLINGPVCSASMGSRDLNENMSCASASASAAQVPVQTNMHLARPDPNGALMQCSQESSEVSEGHTSEEEENDVGDTKPVREISCQINKEKDLSNTTSCPEKTARRVMTVRYLLGELKALVASQDSEAVRLISEVEQSISLLPLMVGSTNIQAEIALALQPLRSENVQLRRRLRILNQQLLERERAERRARPVDCNMEVVALQSLNFTLQTQLNESHREYQNLQQENMRLQNTLEKKENDWQQHKEQLQTENSRLRLELSEALAEMKSCQMKLQDELEKNVLTQSLQQGESEVHRLQEFIRSLQTSQIKSNVSQSSQQLDLHQPNSQLTKSVLELHETAQRETTASDKISSTVKTYLQTLEGTGQASPPQRARIIRSEREFCPPENQEIHNPSLEVISENVSAKAEQKATSFAPLRETSVGQHVSGVPPGKSLTHGDELTVNKQKVENIGLRYMARAFEKLGVSDELNQILDQSQQCVKMDVRERYSAGRPSAMETTFASLASDMSVKSWTTFNTRDEQNFRDGLAALDASIESLQKTLRSNLNK